MAVQREYQGVLVGVGHNGMAKYGSSQKDGRSDLVKDQEANGQNTNRCPYGCNDEELDEQGYCFHIIGFSPDGKKLERNVIDPDGRIRTKANIRNVNGRMSMVHDERIDKEKVKAGTIILDPVVKGGTCRVYEDIPRPVDYPDHVSDELTDEELAAIDAEEEDEEPETEPEPRRRRKHSKE